MPHHIKGLRDIEKKHFYTLINKKKNLHVLSQSQNEQYFSNLHLPILIVS